MVTSNFFTADTARLHRYYIPFFIKIDTHEMLHTGTTANPTGAWTTQAAQSLFLHHSDQLDAALAPVRDRGSQLVDAFDQILPTEGFKTPRTPARTPAANTFAERRIGSTRQELLKQPTGLPRTTIWNHRQLEHLIIDHIEHHNQHRPHQSLRQHPPTPDHSPTQTPPTTPTMLRTSRCHGLIHEHRNAA
jgi:transposase InsO family protein